MKIQSVKTLRVLCGLAAAFALAAGVAAVPASAASAGVYLAVVAPHYKHPVTGVIEDSGGEGSAVLGQSMTESATCKKALVEVDASGGAFVTVRLQLMDNIKDVQFQVSPGGDSAFSPVSVSVMQEDFTENTADYRLKVSDENAIIRCGMYVIAMGRSVVFYMTVSDLVPGSGDFITSVKAETPAATIRPPESTAPSETTRPAETTAPPAATQSTAGLPAEESASASSRDGAELTTAKGLQEFDAAGNAAENSAVDAGAARNGGNLAGWILGGLAAALVAAGGVWYFGFFRPKNGRGARYQ